jgi:hypothetical protein
MNHFIKIFLLIIFIFFTGCEVEEIVNPNDVYVEYTVVQAEIQPGKVFPAVRFTKTLPLGVPYDIKKSELKDVTVYIKKNEVQVIPLIYDVDGLYKPTYRFYVLEGETYELFAETNDKYIYAKTIIPYTPSISSTNYNTSDFYLNAELQTKSNEVYGAIWIIPGNPPDKAEDFFSVSNTSYNPGTEIIVRTSSFPDKYRSQIYDDSRHIQVFAFDKSFREYFYSRTSGQQINDPFVQGGGSVEWNVQGDKVIGMFIGVTPGDIIKVN